MANDALIGHTGFVGGNLVRQHAFAACFNSSNIERIAGRSFERLVCAGLPAAKWIANREPEADAANLQRLIAALEQVEAEQVVVISTIDVYPQPWEVDEETPIDPHAPLGHPYGRHRLLFEQAVRRRFAHSLVIRLPGLFGPGLKKNAIFDLLHDHEVHKIHADGLFQFYGLDHLWADIETALAAKLELVNFATAALTVGEIAREAMDLDFTNRPPGPPARYTFRSRHAAVFGGRDGLLYSREQVLADLRAFVAQERGRDR